ncbi:MAG: coenzyme A pyrophosphatase [Sphingomonas sp. SCN 67-18]|uniref:CoA pyrophosphatase n=1 Tax=uncultured Sphingomonas sp. TaxID=158754 RepID=UPI00086F8850|nr:CoA pyrophosphatase [Sphingomonas sp. SCN 67-18]ODU20492.1 MAG: coenzyme A pyrophosphatase [Sphingomonas sp. SCN 67-18]
MSALTERLRHALAVGGARQTILLESDTLDLTAGAGDVLVPAAVLVAVTDRPEPGVILTQRTQSLRRHAGQIAFPGGRIDPGDASPIAAALREAEEEIALPRSAVTVIGRTDAYRTVTGFHIVPVIGVVPPDLPLAINDAEVESWFEVPLAYLLEPGNHIEQAVEWQGRERRYYEIMWDGHRIWGATAAMIINLGRRLAWPE